MNEPAKTISEELSDPWYEIRPPVKSLAQSIDPLITVSFSFIGKAKTAGKMTLGFNGPALRKLNLDDANNVRLAFGRRENMGKLLVTPDENGPFKLAKNAWGGARITIPDQPGFPNNPMPREAAPFVQVKDGKSFIVTLPEWGIPDDTRPPRIQLLPPESVPKNSALINPQQHERIKPEITFTGKFIGVTGHKTPIQLPAIGSLVLQVLYTMWGRYVSRPTLIEKIVMANHGIKVSDVDRLLDLKSLEDINKAIAGLNLVVLEAPGDSSWKLYWRS